MSPSNAELLPCPFCGFKPEVDHADCIYPAARPEYDPLEDRLVHKVWNINCYETGGGCSANVLGDSPEDCIKKWNSRAK